MDAKFCNVCQALVIPEDGNFSLRCPNCKTPFPEETPAPATETGNQSRPIGFGTEKTVTPRRGVGWR